MENTMGRLSYSNSHFADDLNKISTADLRKSGYLVGFKRGLVGWEDKLGEDFGSVSLSVQINEIGGIMRLAYSYWDFNGGEEDIAYNVYLTTTQCSYGGRRYWFICPLKTVYGSCRKRVGKLYQVGKYFGCRHCYNLTYRSRKWNKRSRFYAWDQSRALEEKLDKAWMSLKRSYYAAKPTKGQRELWQLEVILGYGSRVEFHGESIEL